MNLAQHLEDKAWYELGGCDVNTPRLSPRNQNVISLYAQYIVTAKTINAKEVPAQILKEYMQSTQ